MSGEEDQYESLPDGVSLRFTLMAGAAAGIGEHCLMFPVDCVKTRMQALACDKPKLQSRSIWRNLWFIMRTEGLFRPMQGVQAMALGAGPAHAMYFGCYEMLKSKLTPLARSSTVPEFVVHFGAGAAATVLHDAIMTPAEVVKQRMQMCCSPHRTTLSCAASVYRTEGLAAFYRSYPTMLAMNIPFQCVHFAVYEAMQDWINPGREYRPLRHAVSGAAAGAVASAVTMPLDVCKTLLNTQEANVLARLNASKVVGLWSAGVTVNRLAGFTGFYKGLWPRVLYQMPSTAIAWTTYEFFKFTLPYMMHSSDEGKEESLVELQCRHEAAQPGETRPGQDRDPKFWDSIVRSKHEVVAETEHRVTAGCDLVARDRTFPSFRTEA